MQEEKLKKAIEEWDEVIHNNFHSGMINGASLATSEITSILDKFSMWLLAGVGGTAALIIANIDKVTPYTGIGGFKYIVLFLCASAIFGFLVLCETIKKTAFKVWFFSKTLFYSGAFVSCS